MIVLSLTRKSSALSAGSDSALTFAEKEMSKLAIIAATIVVTLLVQALLLRSWFVRTTVLDLIEPRPDHEWGFVLTQSVELRDHEKKVGELAAGQILYQPCRHDTHLTDPWDPRVLKIYVEFGGTTSWDGYATLIKDAPSTGSRRDRIYLEAK